MQVQAGIPRRAGRRHPGDHPALPGSRHRRATRCSESEAAAGPRRAPDGHPLVRRAGDADGPDRDASVRRSRSSASSSSSSATWSQVVPDYRPDHRRAGGPDRARRPVRGHERAVRSREHRHRGDDAERRPSWRSWSPRSSPRPSRRSSRRPFFGGHARAIHRPGCCRRVAACSSRSCTPGYRSASAPTRSSAARSSTSLAVGVDGAISTLLVSAELAGPAPGYFDAVRAADWLVGPAVRRLGAGRVFNQGPIAMSVIVSSIVLQIFLFRSRWGLRTRAVGEHPKAAETVGIDVIRASLSQRHPRRPLRRARRRVPHPGSTGSFQSG